MSVDPVAGASSAQQAEPVFKPKGSEQSYLDYNAFLMLFMESLKSQDPTDPLKRLSIWGSWRSSLLLSNLQRPTKT